MATMGDSPFDADWVVVGSGFGGSVSALRLSEKGYRVHVLERGEHFDDADMPKSSWDVRRYFYAPKLGMRGIFKLTFFRDVSIMSGAGVGGGSLTYAMTLYVPPQAFFEDRQWADLADWRAELAPHYETAQRMLGVTDVVADDPADQLLKRYAEEIGVGETYRKARIGTYIDTPGKTVADPYFGGAGPQRTGCINLGRCMLGCPQGSKNSTTKNYLHFAQKLGARIRARREVVALRPLNGSDGAAGWEIVHERTGARWRKDRQTLRARGVVVAGGALGTNELLARARLNGDLPKLSPRLGHLVRTNSEAILGVTVPAGRAQALSKRVAITSSIYPDPHTHIETVTYGAGGGALRGMFTVLTGDGTRLTRPLKWLGQMLRHPKWVFELLFSRDWSQRTVIVLVMQSLDNSMRLVVKRRRRDGGVKLTTKQDPEHPNPTFLPAGNAFAAWLARETGGVPGSAFAEAVFNVPSTAHILGGAPIGATPEQGVVDRDQRVFGYENLLVCDGAAIPANVGVNPSLTITAMTERAMDRIPAKEGAAVTPPLGRAAIAGKTASGEPEPVPESVTPAGAVREQATATRA